VSNADGASITTRVASATLASRFLAAPGGEILVGDDATPLPLWVWTTVSRSGPLTRWTNRFRTMTKLEPWAYVRDLMLRLSVGETDLESMLPDPWGSSHPEHVLEHRLDESRRNAARRKGKRECIAQRGGPSVEGQRQARWTRPDLPVRLGGAPQGGETAARDQGLVPPCAYPAYNIHESSL
jgi:hypothetical protein